MNGLMHCSKHLPHSITSSARISVAGWSRTPSSVAIFKFRDKLEVCGCFDRQIAWRNAAQDLDDVGRRASRQLLFKRSVGHKAAAIRHLTPLANRRQSGDSSRFRQDYPVSRKIRGRHNHKPLYFGCAHLFERAGVLGWRVGLDNLQLDAELLRRRGDCLDVCVMSRWPAGQYGYFPYGRQSFREDGESRGIKRLRAQGDGRYV